MHRVAAIQMVSTPGVEENIATARALVAEAAASGASLVTLPEYWPIMGLRDTDKVGHAEQPGAGPIQAFLAEAAREHGIWLIGGTLPLVSNDAAKVMNTTLVYNPDGARIGRYDKLHLFDVDLPNGDRYRESSAYVAGDRAVVASTPWGKLGLSVCYDVRFPALYRTLAGADAAILSIPAAFTVPTGAAHWHILLRARAIETGCFVVAAAQSGTHADGRSTYGHSLVVDPWGEVLLDMGEGVGAAVVDLDLGAVAAARGRIPALANARAFKLPA